MNKRIIKFLILLFVGFIVFSVILKFSVAKTNCSVTNNETLTPILKIHLEDIDNKAKYPPVKSFSSQEAYNIELNKYLKSQVILENAELSSEEENEIWSFIDDGIAFFAKQKSSCELQSLIKKGNALLNKKYNNPYVLFFTGYLLRYERKYKESVDLLRQAVSKEKTKLFNYLILAELTEILFKIGRADRKEAFNLKFVTADAYTDLIKSSGLNNEHINILYRLFAQRGDPFDAHDAWDLITKRMNEPEIDPWLFRMLNGDSCVKHAWLLRGSDWASEVTKGGWEGFYENLSKARKFFVEAWEMKPNFPEAAAEMMTVVTGECNSDENIELWFNRMRGAQYDYLPAYNKMLWALRPRWGGDYQTMYKFGEQCLFEERFDTLVPLYYLHSLIKIAADLPYIYWHAPFLDKRIQNRIEYLFSSYLANENFKSEKDLILYFKSQVYMWGRKYDFAKEIIEKLPPDLNVNLGFHGKFITRGNQPKDMINEELNLYTGDDKNLTLKADELIFQGKIDNAVSILTDLMNKYKNNKNMHKYLLDKIGFIMTGINSDQAYASMKITPLHVAARENKMEIVKFYVENGGDLEAEDICGDTPLNTAIAYNNFEVVKYLIDHNADINHSNLSLYYPIRKAIYSKDSRILELIMSHNPYLLFTDVLGFSPVYCAVEKNNLSLLKRFIQMGADVNSRNIYGWTPLTLAVDIGNNDIVTELLKVKNIELNSPSPDGCHPLIFAIWYNKEEIAEMLIENSCDIDCKYKDVYFPVYLAILNDMPKLAKLLINNGAKINEIGPDGWTPLHQASKKGYEDIIKMLLARGANINTQDNEGFTALFTAIINRKENIARLLIENGAAIDIKTNNGYTALYAVLDFGFQDLCLLLIDSGMDLNIKYPKGWTVLHLAVSRGHIEIVKRLLEKGANKDSKLDSGETPLKLAELSKNRDMIELLQN